MFPRPGTSRLITSQELLLYLTTSTRPAMTRSPLIGKPAPALALPDAKGETYNLTPESAGVPIALFFYPKSGVHFSSPCRPFICD